MKNEVIGDAVLYLGDCLEILPTLPKVDAVITDPPYGVGIAAWDARMPVDWFGICLSLLNKSGVAYIFGDPVEIARFQTYWSSYGVNWKARCVWVYESGPRNAKTWTRKHEDCLVFHMPSHRQSTPTEPSTHADPRWGVERFIGDVWNVPRVLGNYGEREEHPSQKPVALMSMLVDAAPDATLILDPFVGSGTTGVAAINAGRSFIGIEREPKYFDIACRRIEQAYKQRPLFEAQLPKAPEQLSI